MGKRLKLLIFRFLIVMGCLSLLSHPIQADSILNHPTMVEIYDSYIFETCRNYSSIDPILVKAIIIHESNYTPNVVSRTGAVGLMQIMPKWNYERMVRLKATNLYDPFSNIRVGIDLLDDLYSRTNNECFAVMAYAYGYSKAKHYWRLGIVPKGVKEIYSISCQLKKER